MQRDPDLNDTIECYRSVSNRTVTLGSLRIDGRREPQKFGLKELSVFMALEGD